MNNNLDPASLLDATVQDFSSLPPELAHLLHEIRLKDLKFYDTRKRIQQRDNQIHKFIRANSSLAPNPKEASTYPKIVADFETAMKLQEDKCKLANTALYIYELHFQKLQKYLDEMEANGTLPPLSELTEIQHLAAVLNGEVPSSVTPAVPAAATPEKPARRSTPVARPLKKQRLQSSTPATPQASAALSKPEDTTSSETVARAEPLGSETADRAGAGPANDGEDELYCFCRQVSFGEMIGCDSPDCKYEWFHYVCVGLKEPPTGTWYCPDCAERKKLELEKEKEKEKDKDKEKEPRRRKK